MFQIVSGFAAFVEKPKMKKKTMAQTNAHGKHSRCLSFRINRNCNRFSAGETQKSVYETAASVFFWGIVFFLKFNTVRIVIVFDTVIGFYVKFPLI